MFIRLATGQLDSRVVNDDRPHLNMIGSNGPARLWFCHKIELYKRKNLDKLFYIHSIIFISLKSVFIYLKQEKARSLNSFKNLEWAILVIVYLLGTQTRYNHEMH